MGNMSFLVLQVHLHQWGVRRAQVTAEHNALAGLANFTLHIGRAQNVPGRLQLDA
jgi:hypothetical protein